MLEELTMDQRRLADFMSELSEQAYCAVWMMDLEYALWEGVVGTRREYGRLEISEAHRARLRELADSCDGWIVFDDDTGETWLPRAEWERRFAVRSRAGDRFD